MRRLNCIFPEYSKAERQYTWNSKWITTFESPWGIFEKFKYANRLNTKDLLSIFGDENVKNKKIISCSQQNCDLINMERLNNETMIRILNMDVRSMNLENMNLMTFVPRYRPYQDFFRKHLTYCLKCMKYGYHSILNQFSLIHECPIHEDKLLDCCPKCNQSYPYKLNDDPFIEPFQCSCGYNFLDGINNYSQTWESNKPIITSPEVINWISMYKNQKVNFDNLILSSELSIRSMPGAMDFIFQAIDRSYLSLRTEKHFVSKSGSNIMLHGNYYSEFQTIRDSGSDEKYLAFIAKMNEAIYQSNRSAFYGIAKHLRTTIMRGHTACIRKPGLSEKKCPYAFAYVNWRKLIEGHNDWWQVDNRYRPSRQLSKYEMEFITKQDDSAMWDTVTKLEYGRPFWKYKHLTATMWIINKVLAHLVLNHFYSWLEIAQSNESLAKEYHSVPFGYQNVPFFLIKLPKNNEGELEFHWWLSDQHQHLFKINNHLKCPF